MIKNDKFNLLFFLLLPKGGNAVVEIVLVVVVVKRIRTSDLQIVGKRCILVR